MSHFSSPFLSLQAATFRLGERLIFQNTNWTWRRHEHWAVLGANGSGKSLLADALRGHLPLVGGQLVLHWRGPEKGAPEDAIGQVSFENRKQSVQDTVAQARWSSLEEEGALRVEEFLSYERVMDVNPFEQREGRELARAQFERRRRRAQALLEVEPFLERALFSLSNGETQRVQLARALCHPMRLLILDEPFTGLDAAARQHFLRVLERLMRSPLRVLLITTRLEDLPRHITHVLQVADCRVVSAGPRDAGAAKPARNGRGVTALAGSLKSSALLRPQKSSAAKSGKPHPAAPGEGKPLIELRKVSVRYGSTVIFEDLDWTVREGSSWAVLGPNGSGKTTLLSLIQGDHPQAYANSVTVFGRRRGTGESIWELKRRMGWVSPELHLSFDDSQTCFEVVASGFRDSVGLFEPPTSRQRTQAREWLRLFGLLDSAATPLFGLSAGQQRMVLLARALVKKPRLLVLDEPCQGLDAAHRRLFVQTVDTLLRGGGVTALYVTHRQDEIPSSIRQILRLKHRDAVAGKKNGARVRIERR